MAGFAHDLLLHLLFAEPLSRPVREEGDGNGIATVFIWTSELDIGPLLVAVVLNPLHNEVHLTPQ